MNTSAHLLSACLIAALACGPAYGERSGPAADAPLVVLGISPISDQSFAGFLPILLEDAVQSRREEGILSWDLFQPEDGKKDLLAVERYRNRATFDKHLEKPYVKAFIENIPTAVRGGEAQSAIFMNDLLPATSKPIPSPRTTKNIIAVLSVRQEAMVPVIKALLEVAQAARRENGNLVYDLSQEIAAPHRLVVFQRWETPQAYEAHRRQARLVALDQLLAKSLTQPDREPWRAVRDIGR